MSWSDSLQKLKSGDLTAWPEHNCIPNGRSDQFTATYGKPVWTGKSNVRLLVNADFGMGDTIHFWRYVLQICEKVDELILRCDDSLHSLLVHPKVKLLSKSDEIPDFDEIVHMMAIPGVVECETNAKPYVSPQGESIPVIQEFKNFEFSKIGLCWCGNPFNPRDIQRSIPHELVNLLFVIPGLQFFTLTKHFAPPEGVRDIRGFFEDWNQTAHALLGMDLIISVDTAVAHLAGALGVPVWLLLSDQTDWRWGVEGSNTLWYDSMQIFRSKGDWAGLLTEVGSKLKQI